MNNLRNTEKKLQFYASKLIVGQLEGGEDYRKLKDVIVIAILDYELTKLPEYHTETVTVAKEHREFEILNCIKYHIIELPKFRRANKNLSNKLDQWLTFIDYRNKVEIEIASKNNKEIKKAVEEVEYLTRDAVEKRRAELREIAKINEMLFLGSMEDFREERYMEGKKEKQIEIAKKLLNKNMPIDKIIEITEITTEEAEKIKKRSEK